MILCRMKKTCVCDTSIVAELLWIHLVGGAITILKNHGVKVSWDDYPIPIYYGKSYNSIVPKNQPDIWESHIYIYTHYILGNLHIYIYIYILTNQMVPKHQPVMVEPCWWTNVDDLQKITKKVTKNWPSRWSSDLFPLKSVDFVEPASYVNVGFC